MRERVRSALQLIAVGWEGCAQEGLGRKLFVLGFKQRLSCLLLVIERAQCDRSDRS
jgi:hypothetical protein